LSPGKGSHLHAERNGHKADLARKLNITPTLVDRLETALALFDKRLLVDINP